MRIGISSASFFNKVPTEGTFDVMRQMRADVAEIFLTSFCEYEKPFVEALMSRKGNIAVHSVHAAAMQFEPELYSSNARQRADAEVFFRKVCYAGHVLGAKFYTFQGPSRLKSINYSFDFTRLGDRTNQLIYIAQSYGLRLSYENAHWSYFAEPEYFEQLHHRCPNLYGTLNIKHALLAGQNVYKMLDAFGDRLSTIHLCDMDGRETALPGHGKFNFEKLFKSLDERGLTVPMFIDAHSRDYNDLNQLKDSFDLMNAKLIKVRNA